MSRRFLQRKEPDWHAIILFRYFDYETSGSPRTKDDDEHEDESSISEFRFKGARIHLSTLGLQAFGAFGRNDAEIFLSYLSSPFLSQVGD